LHCSKQAYILGSFFEKVKALKMNKGLFRTNRAAMNNINIQEYSMLQVQQEEVGVFTLERIALNDE